MKTEQLVNKKADINEALEVAGGVFGGLVVSATINRIAQAKGMPKAGAVVNLAAGATIASFAKPKWAVAFGATHAVVGGADGIRAVAGEIKYLPKLSGLNGRRRRRSLRGMETAPMLQGYEAMLQGSEAMLQGSALV